MGKERKKEEKNGEKRKIKQKVQFYQKYRHKILIFAREKYFCSLPNACAKCQYLYEYLLAIILSTNIKHCGGVVGEGGLLFWSKKSVFMPKMGLIIIALKSNIHLFSKIGTLTGSFRLQKAEINVATVYIIEHYRILI